MFLKLADANIYIKNVLRASLTKIFQVWKKKKPPKRRRIIKNTGSIKTNSTKA